jgi:hypothetical protein
MSRPAHVSRSCGPDGTAYLVQCGGSSGDRMFHDLKPALRYARKHNIKHHHGAVPQYRDSLYRDRKKQPAGFFEPLKKGDEKGD